ncbi:MAG TPA: hypothetical protein VNL37_04355, partial [Candidatus Polarisedimenticolia bacterium]|nr:hypothetical protein [Candidatus Polarisedimenticolia bacterium]
MTHFIQHMRLSSAARRRSVLLGLGTAALLLTGALVAPADGLVSGPKPDGTSVTPQGWRVTPSGTQTDVGPGPMSIAMSPLGDTLLVTTGGYEDNSLLVVDP